MAAIERADSDRKDEVEGRFTGLQRKVLGRSLANAHSTRGNLVGTVRLSLSDRVGRPVDGEDVPGNQPSCHSPRGSTRPASDLEDTCVRCERQRIHDPGKTRR